MYPNTESKDLDRLIETFEEMPKQVKRAATNALQYVGAKFYKAFKGRTGVRMRGMWRSFKKKVTYKGVGDDFGRLTIYSDSEAALKHESGGVIRARGKLLMVPLRSAKDKIGQYFAKKQKGGNWIATQSVKDDLFVLKGAGNQRTLALARNGRLIPMFALKSQISIQPRLNFYKTWDETKESAFQGAADRIFYAVRNYWRNKDWKYQKY